jgi:predicted CDP-diglyceride synthetase/phosphatidate cytidylyltransferase
MQGIITTIIMINKLYRNYIPANIFLNAFRYGENIKHNKYIDEVIMRHVKKKGRQKDFGKVMGVFLG